MNLKQSAAVLLAAFLASPVLAEGQGPGVVAGTAQIGEMPDTFTIPQSQHDYSAPTGCTTLMAGCTGEIRTLLYNVQGNISVVDDCTFNVTGWQFDDSNNPPAVEWWGAKQNNNKLKFPYPETAQKIGELGAPGNYTVGDLNGGDSRIVVRLGLNDMGEQILLSPELNHISVWCEDVAVDFGNAALTCPSAPVSSVSTANGTATATSSASATGVTTSSSSDSSSSGSRGINLTSGNEIPPDAAEASETQIEMINGCNVHATIVAAVTLTLVGLVLL